MSEETELAGVRLTSPEKVLYPDQGVTKRALAEYYVEIAGVMLPHVKDRPITLVRCPAGQEKKCFYQRHPGSGVPKELAEFLVPGFEDSGPYLYVQNVQGLVALVQMGVLEIHPWNMRIDRPDRPDMIVMDLDPGEGTPLAAVVRAAHEVRAMMMGLKLQSFCKTSGGKGLHVVVPFERRTEWKEAKAFAKAIADRMTAVAPDRYLAKSSIAARRGKIFVDYFRNDQTSTSVAPYSSRAREGATVATPLHWDEVTDELDPRSFTIATVPERIERLGGDPWSEMLEVRQRLPAASALEE
ncbi:non-homologous end-joining DNA ligase [Lutibaculum baratangense]|uniref:ATP-dependent DNA ligase clustered with Ku protein, LigD n=1 Tax=Lutibaculum baratangense AMV1 TaxID=631454 RepID=V4QVT0_9HYPH|nr:non-homologous end-joining DNA ligase [Lutibaculum baratangense]ESR23857.1 ATP-dependent DNA ligase clustered with Ku protein, LigD [Lutibaculum baratangense AMV1]